MGKNLNTIWHDPPLIVEKFNRLCCSPEPYNFGNELDHYEGQGNTLTPNIKLIL